MKISGTPPPISPTSVAATPLPNWRPGQTLSGTVLEADPVQALLRIGDQNFRAPSPPPLVPGQQLIMRVDRPGPTPLLRITSSIPPPNDAVASTLREMLPRQLPLAKGYEALMRAANDGKPAPRQQSFPGELRDVLRQLAGHLPTRETVTDPARLRQAIQNSGQLLEHRLLKGSAEAASTSDLKGLLLRVVANLRALLPVPAPAPQGTASLVRNQAHALTPPVPPRHPNNAITPLPADKDVESLLRVAEGTLAKLTLNQLEGARHHDAERPLIYLELPIRVENERIETLKLRIEHERSRRGEADEDRPWTVTLGFDIEPIGPMSAKINFQAGEISTWFWAERPDAVERINTELGSLERELGEAGIPAHLNPCRQGNMPTPVHTISVDPILDAEA
jgi:hypothetical protein